MDFIQESEPDIKKPIIIASMQDMGNVGSIVIDFINKKLKTKTFRSAKASFPSFVIDKGGHVELPMEKWDYKYTKNLIIFGGGSGQPQANKDLCLLCQDVIDISKKYSAKILYTLGGFHTNRIFTNLPKTFVTTTSPNLSQQMEKLGVELTPQKSVITGFNGLILGYAKLNGIQGIGLYGELNNPEIAQYRTAISIIKTLERLTFQSFGNTGELESNAVSQDNKLQGRWYD